MGRNAHDWRSMSFGARRETQQERRRWQLPAEAKEQLRTAAVEPVEPGKRPALVIGLLAPFSLLHGAV